MRRQILSLTSIAAMMACVAQPILAQDAKISSPGHYSGYAPLLYDGWVRSNFFVEARDGVRLAMTLYQPAVRGKPVSTPYPVLFAFTPYRRLYKDSDGKITGLAEEGKAPDRIADLTRYGYVVAVADVRGKGASFGVRGAYQDAQEARDAYDLVEWLSGQPWANGKVGMFGCSYYAGTQLAAARMQPPHLRAIFPEAGPFDAYRMAQKGGISGQFNTRYQSNKEDIGTIPVDSDPNGVLAEQARKQHSANGQMLDIITQMPFRDDRDPGTDVPYWRDVSPFMSTDVIERSGIAVYHWANWFDEVNDQSLISFSTLTNPRKLMIGIGTHCDIGTMDSTAEHHRFYDHYLKGIDNGIDREPPVYYRTIGAPAGDEWRFAPSWPPPGVRQETWHLDADPSGSIAKTAIDGSLGEEPGRPTDVPYTVNYDVGCIVDPRFMPDVGLPKPGQENKPQPGYWPCVLDKIGATFTTKALARDVTIVGTPVIKLMMSATHDVNVFAYLETVSADGKVEIISHGRLKASARKLSPAPYNNMGLPWHSNMRSDAQSVVPGQPFEMLFDLSATAIRIPAGTRLRLTITGADLRQRNLDAIKVNPAPQMMIHTGKGGSELTIPTLPVDAQSS